MPDVDPIQMSERADEAKRQFLDVIRDQSTQGVNDIKILVLNVSDARSIRFSACRDKAEDRRIIAST